MAYVTYVTFISFGGRKMPKLGHHHFVAGKSDLAAFWNARAHE
jgi:hypothetical protein